MTIEELMKQWSFAAETLGVASLEAFTLIRGRQFHPVPLPARVARGAPKNCFGNALQVVLDADEDLNYRYVEGYVVSDNLPLLIHHGWVAVDGEDVAIDPTLSDPESYEYWGIAFPTDYVIETCNRRGVTGHTLHWFAHDTLNDSEG